MFKTISEYEVIVDIRSNNAEVRYIITLSYEEATSIYNNLNQQSSENWPKALVDLYGLLGRYVG